MMMPAPVMFDLLNNDSTNAGSLTITSSQSPSPPNDPPQVTTLYLLNEAGIVGDNLTSDPRITGVLMDHGFNPSSNGAYSMYSIEIDLCGDGSIEQTVPANWDHTFTYDPSWNGQHYGVVTAGARGIESVSDGQTLYGGWQMLTYTYQAPVNDPPQVINLHLLNDTGIIGDNLTCDPQVMGTLTDDGFNPLPTGMASMPSASLMYSVEVDLGGDGSIDQTVSPSWDHTFTYDPRWNGQQYGVVTIAARGVESDPDGQTLYGDWQTLTYIYQAPANDPPQVTNLHLLNDTEVVGGNLTSDPQVTATLTDDGFNSSSLGMPSMPAAASMYSVEVDLGGDGSIDQTVSPNWDHTFTYDPRWNGEQSGVVTIAARGVESTPNGQTLYGDWQTLTFTYTGGSLTAYGDSFFDFAPANPSFSGGNVLANDIDTYPTHGAIAASLLMQTSHGTVVLDSAESFTYTLFDAAFAGDDSFTYQVSDGEHTATANAVIQVANLKLVDTSSRDVTNNLQNPTPIWDGQQAEVFAELANLGNNAATYSWSFTGNPIKDYKIETNTVTYFSANDLEQSSVRYYYYDSRGA